MSLTKFKKNELYLYSNSMKNKYNKKTCQVQQTEYSKLTAKHLRN